MENDGGYFFAASVNLDAKIKPSANPYTLNITTFE
jgi:hypothetical protein